MIIIKCDNVDDKGTINFIYFKENSMHSNNLFIDASDIEETAKNKDFKRYNAVEKKILKECIKYANRKDCFESNKSYKFVDIYKATIALNNVIIR